MKLPYSKQYVLDTIFECRGDLSVASIYFGRSQSFLRSKRRSRVEIPFKHNLPAQELARLMRKHEFVSRVMLKALFNMGVGDHQYNQLGLPRQTTTIHIDSFIPYSELLRQAKIAERTGISSCVGYDRNVLTRRLRLLGLYQPSRNAFVPETKQIVSEYANGKHLAQLEREYGYSRRKIAGWLQRNGMKVRNRSEWGLTRRNINPEQYTDAADIRKLTEFVYDHHCDRINRDGLVRGRATFHLDHRYSILDYHLNSEVNIWEICHPANLTMLDSRANSIKAGNSSVSARQLLEDIRDWDAIYSDPYFTSQHPIVEYIRQKYGEYDGPYADQAIGRYYGLSQGWRKAA